MPAGPGARHDGSAAVGTSGHGAAVGRTGAAMIDTGIAVIGMCVRFPGARDVEQFWSNLRAGVISLRRYDAAALHAAGADPSLLAHPRFVPVSGALPDADQFDPDFFGISRREADLMDPQHRLLLECAWELLDRIGYGAPH